MMRLSLVILVINVWSDTRENVHDIEKEFLVVDIAIGIILHSRICVYD